MSFAREAGRFVGRVGADAFEGSKLVSTQFAQGAREGYEQRAAHLRALRAQALAGVEVQAQPKAEPKPKTPKVQVAA